MPFSGAANSTSRPGKLFHLYGRLTASAAPENGAHFQGQLMPSAAPKDLFLGAGRLL